MLASFLLVGNTAVLLPAPPAAPVALRRLDPDWWEPSVRQSLPSVAPRPKDKATNAMPPSALEASTADVANPGEAHSLNELTQALHQNEASVSQLEHDLVSMHSRLAKAEDVDVAASGNMSLARSGIYKLTLDTKDSADALKAVTGTSAKLHSALDRAETMLNGAAKRVHSASEHAALAASVAKKMTVEKALASQEALNDRMWRLMDPDDKYSLDKAEKDVHMLEEAVGKLRGQIAGEVKTAMTSKMQVETRNLRKAIRRLGSAARGASESHLGATDN